MEVESGRHGESRRERGVGKMCAQKHEEGRGGYCVRRNRRSLGGKQEDEEHRWGTGREERERRLHFYTFSENNKIVRRMTMRRKNTTSKCIRPEC